MGGSVINKVKVIFFFFKEIYVVGLLWIIIKSLCREMKWFDWLEIVVKVSVMIIVVFVIEGVVLIVKIVLIVLVVVDFVRKIVNLV